MNTSETANPYQAATQLTNVDIDLVRPIEFEIDVRPEDWGVYFKQSRRGERIALFGFVFTAAVGVVHSLSAGQTMSLLMVLGIASFVAILLYLANDPRRHAEACVNDGQCLSGRIAVRVESQAIRLENEGQVWHYFWGGISKLRLGRDWLMITIEPHGPNALLLQRGSPDHWKQLISALGPAAPAIRLARGRGRDIEQAKQLCGSAPSGAIEYDLCLTGRDYTKLSESMTTREKERVGESRGFRYWAPIVLALLAVTLGVSLALFRRQDEVAAWTTRTLVFGFVCLALPLLVILGIYVFFKLTLKKQAQSDEVIASVQGWLDDSGLIQLGPAGWQRLPYSQMTLASVTEDVAVIRHAQRPHYYFLKKPAFADEASWSRAIGLLQNARHA